MFSIENLSYKDYCCSDQKLERTGLPEISRKPADSVPGSYRGGASKSVYSNPDPEYETYEYENTPPSKNNMIQHDDWNTQESPGGMESCTNSTALYTAEKSNMDYFTLAGVCKRTGCSIDELIVWALRQLIDNGVDFVESNHDENLHSDDTRIFISIRYDPNTNQLILNVSNPNFGKYEAGFTEKRVNTIFNDLNQFVSSKRNLFKLTRGYQGDAMQEELGIPTALASKYRKGGEWDEPLTIWNGAGQEFEIRIVIDKINGRNYSKIKTNQTDRADNYTQVEIRVPYDKDIINLDEIKNVLIEYALLNTHISFNFDLVDYINTDNPFEFE